MTSKHKESSISISVLVEPQASTKKFIWHLKKQKAKKKKKFEKTYNVKLTNIFTNARAHYFFGKTKTMIRKKKTFKYILGILSIFGKCLFPKSHPLLCFFGSAHFRLPPAFIRHMSMKDCQKLSRNDY